LVELLVVITILAVLVALLLPALSIAKARSKAIKCANQEQQIGVAFTGYLNDNSGFYPYIYPECVCTNYYAQYQQGWCSVYQGTAYCMDYPSASQNAGGWNYVIAPYLGCPLSALQTRIACNTCGIVGCCPASVIAEYNTYSQVFSCPSNPWSFPAGGYRLSASGYEMNVDNFPETWRCDGANDCGASPNNPRGWSRRVNLSDLHQASTLMLMGEIPLDGNVMDNPWGQLNGGGWGYTLPYGGTAGMAALQVTNVWNITWTGVNPDPRIWLMPNCNAFVAAFHDQGMNVLFADSHVERLSKATLLSYSVDMEQLGPSLKPGIKFWTDGRGLLGVSSNGGETHWYDNQFPGASYPN
jgi:prepilin-type processing-associated H-X9-DG protein